MDKTLPIFSLSLLTSYTKKSELFNCEAATVNSNALAKSHLFGVGKSFLQSLRVSRTRKSPHYLQNVLRPSGKKGAIYRHNNSQHSHESHIHSFQYFTTPQTSLFPKCSVQDETRGTFLPQKHKSSKETTKCFNITLKIHTPIWSQSEGGKKRPQNCFWLWQS